MPRSHISDAKALSAYFGWRGYEVTENAGLGSISFVAKFSRRISLIWAFASRPEITLPNVANRVCISSVNNPWDSIQYGGDRVMYGIGVPFPSKICDAVELTKMAQFFHNAGVNRHWFRNDYRSSFPVTSYEHLRDLNLLLSNGHEFYETIMTSAWLDRRERDRQVHRQQREEVLNGDNGYDAIFDFSSVAS